MTARYHQLFTSFLKVSILLVSSCRRTEAPPIQTPTLPSSEVEKLLEQIDEHKFASRFADAIPLAQKLKDLKASSGSQRQVAQADHLLSHLQRCATLPRHQQSELAKADAAVETIEKCIRDAKSDEALNLLKNQLEVYKRLLGEQSFPVAAALELSVEAWNQKTNYAEAKQCAQSCVAITEALHGRKDIDFARRLALLAKVDVRSGSLSEADARLSEALATQREVLPEEHLDIADTLESLAELRQRQSKDSEAESLLQEAIRIRKLLGSDAARIALSLHSLAGTYLNRGMFRDAEKQLRDALSIMERSYRANHPETAATLTSLGNAQTGLSSFADAEKSFSKALDMLRTDGSAKSLKATKAMNGLATLMVQMGKYPRANSLYLESLAIQKTLLGNESTDVAETQTGLADLRAAEGNYSTAESLCREAMSIFRAVSETPTFHEVLAIQSLGEVMVFKGNYYEAERLFEMAFDLHKGLGTDQYLMASVALNNLAHAKIALSKFDAAQSLLEKVIEFRQARLGRKHLLVANSILNLGEVARNKGQYEEAARLHSEALAIRREIFGPSHPAVTESMAILARIKAATGDANAAISRQREVLVKRREQLGHDHPDTAGTAFQLALALYANNELPSAIAVLEEALQVVEGRVMGVAGDERELSQVSGVLRLPRIASLLAHAYVQIGEPLKALEAFERGKSRAVLDLIGRAETSRPSQPPSANLKPAQAAVQPAKYDEIRNALKAGELLIVYNWSDDCFSVVTVPASPAESKSAILAEKAAGATELTSLAYQYLFRMARRFALDGDEFAALARRLVPETIRAQISSAERVILIAGGPLRYLPLETLLLAIHEQDGQPSTWKVPPIVYVDSASLFLNRRSRGDQIALSSTSAESLGTLLLGDPEFDYSVALPNSKMELQTTAANRTLTSLSANVDRLPSHRLTPLPGTRLECKAVASAIHRAGGSPTLLQGDQATLLQLEKNIPEKKIIHLATHGLLGTWARPYEARLALTGTPNAGQNEHGFLTLDHMLKEWQGRLRSCELVVLSGCDTQPGFAEFDDDSILSLSVGFMYAGTPTVIASLWKVDDTATTLLMERFYRNLLAGNDVAVSRFKGKDRALHEAKLWLRGLKRADAEEALVSLGFTDAVCDASTVENSRAPVRREPSGPPVQNPSPCDFSHPYYWAAFVLTGEPD